MAILPISLPTSAGVNRGNGDVRHFSESDSVSVPSISGPDRELAYRDNLLVQKLNETIEVVNNKEQFVPITVLSTSLPPNDETVVTNFRIPSGFEARVLNAAVSADPTSSNIELNIYYATGFGNTSGIAIVTTSNENTSGTSFRQNGEFVIAIKNKGGITLDVVASVLLTMRPIGVVGTILVGSVIQGPRGFPGQTGGKGGSGNPGTGGAGSPGMVWTGDWTNGRGYNSKEVVSFELYGSVVSSYICLTGHMADPSNEPPGPFWDAVAIGSSGTVVGEPGPAGAPGADGAMPILAYALVNGTFVTGADYVGGDTTGDYAGGGASNTTYPTGNPFNEYAIKMPGGTIAMLSGVLKKNFTGNGTIRLPLKVNGAAVDYNNSNIQVTVIDNGSNFGFGGTHSVSSTKVGVPSTDVAIKVLDQYPVKVAILVTGAQIG